MLKIEKIISILKSNGLRVTSPRKAIAETLLKNSNIPLSPEDIYYQIKSSKERKCDLVTVYRVLKTFEELNLIRKSIFQGEAVRYSLTNPPQTSKNGHEQGHEHFFKCNKCHKIESFNDCYVRKKEKQLEKSGYKNISHHLEITGICPDCAKN